MATLINDVAGLQDMELDLAGDYQLVNNIDASDTSTWNGGLGFAPIGNSTTPFTGSFDGKGYTINDLFINRPTESYVGLFGETNDGCSAIQNVGLVDCDITGLHTVGALIGDQSEATLTVSNCYSTGSVSGVRYVIGGLIGINWAGGVDNCYSTCTITCTGGANDAAEVGGLLGHSGGDAANCYATGNVTATSDADVEYIGGFVGSFSSSTISKCYATGDVSITAGARAREIGGFGGFCAGNFSDCYARGSVTVSVDNTSWGAIGGFAGLFQDETIDDCYSTGLLTVTDGVADVGGFCGDNYSAITNCFWDTQTSGKVTSDGGTGKTTAQMKTQSTFTDAGWNFTTIWDIDGVTNNGYPFLNPRVGAGFVQTAIIG